MAAFLIELCTLLRQFAVNAPFLTQASPFFPLGFFLLLLLHQPVGGKFYLFDSQRVKIITDAHFHQDA